jgi:hypothetical protein
VANTSGWRLDSSGTAEFASASIRGQITADQIDTRGFTIKDANGSVLFGAGTNLDWSRVIANSGWLNSNVTTGSIGAIRSDLLGAPSAILNANVTYSGLIGAKPPIDATNGASFGTNVFLPGLGTLNGNQFVNVLSKIGSGNINQFMDGAAITNAYIGNAAIKNANIENLAVTGAKIESLSVDTLQIAGNAVTIPVGNYTEGAAYVNPGVWTTMQLSALNSSGSPIIIIATAFAIPVFGQVGGAQTTSYPEIRVSCNDVEIFKMNGTISFVHQPGAGFKSYKIEARGASGTGASHRSLVLLEAKK